MSFVLEHCRAIDSRLDRIQLSKLSSESHTQSHVAQAKHDLRDPAVHDRLENLQFLIKLLSTTSSTKLPLNNAHYLIGILESAQFSEQCSTCNDFISAFASKDLVQSTPDPCYEHDLEWFLVGKAATQTYALVLSALIDQTLPLSDEISYWNDILSSYRSMGIYSIQTSPLRMWDWSHSVYREVRQRGGAVAQGWKQFYDLVRTVVRERSIEDIQRRVATPLALLRAEVRSKQTGLERARFMNANGIGYLLSNGFADESLQVADRADKISSKKSNTKGDWKSAVVRSISIMDAVLTVAQDQDVAGEDFEEEVIARMTDNVPKPYHQALTDVRQCNEDLTLLLKPSEAAEKLQQILRSSLYRFEAQSQSILDKNGRPPAIVRYWLPAATILLSSSTIYHFIMNRRAAILDSIRDFGSTILDFWINWIVTPLQNVIRTIRHDANSEVSIVSKGSLEGDRASLERMVVDFAVDTNQVPSLDDVGIADIRRKVLEGDLTPVLVVYEKELQHPLRGSLMGSLVRALLIQVQKTKVDVEIAMGGIDSLLKSQELVFGFVGLTPGLLVCYGLLRWVWNFPSSRRNMRSGQNRAAAHQVLRNIDRVLTSSPSSPAPSPDTTPSSPATTLSTKEYGLLICEAIVLRDIAYRRFPRDVFRAFLQDFDDLIEVKRGVARQVRVADRMRWAYGTWL